MTLVKIFQPNFNDSKNFLLDSGFPQEFKSHAPNHERNKDEIKEINETKELNQLNGEKFNIYKRNSLLSPHRNFISSDLLLESIYIKENDQNTNRAISNLSISESEINSNSPKRINGHIDPHDSNTFASAISIDCNGLNDLFGDLMGQFWVEEISKQIWILSFQTCLILIYDITFQKSDIDTKIPVLNRFKSHNGEIVVNKQFTKDEILDKILFRNCIFSIDIIYLEYLFQQNIILQNAYQSSFGDLKKIWNIDSNIVLKFKQDVLIYRIELHNEVPHFNFKLENWLSIENNYQDLTSGITTCKDILLFCSYIENENFKVDVYHMGLRRKIGHLNLNQSSLSIRKTILFQCTSSPDLNLVIVDDRNQIHVYNFFHNFIFENSLSLDNLKDELPEGDIVESTSSIDSENDIKKDSNDSESRDNVTDEVDSDAENDNEEIESDEEQEEQGYEWIKETTRYPREADALLITGRYLQNKLSNQFSLYNIVNNPNRIIPAFRTKVIQSIQNETVDTNNLNKENVNIIEQTLERTEIHLKKNTILNVQMSSKGQIFFYWLDSLVVIDIIVREIVIYTQHEFYGLIKHNFNFNTEIFLSNTNGDIFSILPGTTFKSIIEDLITFNNARLSLSICQMNQWKSEDLLLQSLRDALSNRDTEIVQLSLESIPSEYLVVSLSICMDYLINHQSSSFKNRLTSILLRFVANNIQFDDELGIDFTHVSNSKISQFLLNQTSTFTSEFSFNYSNAIQHSYDTSFEPWSPIEIISFLKIIVEDLRKLLFSSKSKDKSSTSPNEKKMHQFNLENALQSWSDLKGVHFKSNTEEFKRLACDENYLNSAFNDSIATFLSNLSLIGYPIKYHDYRERVKELSIRNLNSQNIPYIEKVLKNIDEDPTIYFRNVMLETYDRNLRRNIFNHIRNLLNEDELKLCLDCELIEIHYPDKEELAFSLIEFASWGRLKDILLFERNYTNVSSIAALNVLCDKNDLETLEKFIYKTSIHELNTFLQESHSDVFFLAWIEDILCDRSVFITSDLGHINRIRASRGHIWSNKKEDFAILSALKLKENEPPTISLQDSQKNVLVVAIQNKLFLFLFVYATYFGINLYKILQELELSSDIIFGYLHSNENQYQLFLNDVKQRTIQEKGDQSISYQLLEHQLITSNNSQTITGIDLLEIEGYKIPFSDNISDNGLLYWKSEEGGTSLGLEYYLTRGRFEDSKRFIQNLGTKAKEVENTIKRVAFSHLNDKSVLFTCLILIVELELDKTIALEIEIATRIFDPEQSEIWARQFQNDPQKVLKKLTKFTKNFILQEGGWHKSLSNIQTIPSPWSLALEFGQRILGKDTITHIMESAENDEWVPMLFELDKLETNYLELLIPYIKSEPLRHHISLALKENYKYEYNFPALIGSRKALSTMSKLIQDGESESYGKKCLEISINEKDELLCICAFILDSSLRIECQLAYSSFKIGGTFSSFNNMLETCILTHSSIICESFRIFNTLTPLRYLFEYVHLFQGGYYDSLENIGKLLFASLENDNHSDKDFCIYLIKNCFGPQIPTYFGRSLLLSNLLQCGISQTYIPEFVTLKRVDKLIDEEGASNIFEISQLNIFTSKINDYIDNLLEMKRFDTARSVANLFKNENILEDITRREANSMISSLKQSKLLNSTLERRIVWSKINKLLVKEEFRQSHSAVFFLNQLEEDSSILPSSDVIYLLRLSLSWFDGSALTAENKRARSIRSQSDLEFLHMSIKILEFEQIVHGDEKTELSTEFIRRMVEWICSVFLPTYKQKNQANLDLTTYVEKIVDEFLFYRDIEIVKSLSQHFDIKTQSIEIAITAINLVKQELDPLDIPSWLQESIEEFDSDTEETTKSKMGRFLNACEAASRSRGIRRFCRTINLDYSIYEALNISFSIFQSKDDKFILEKLILKGPVTWKLASKFVELHSVSSSISTVVCAKIIADLLKEECDCVHKSEVHNEIDFRMNFMQMDSSEKFNEYVSICRDGIELGNRLLSYIEEDGINEQFQVEMIIRAHWSFENGTTIGGMNEKHIDYIINVLTPKLVEKNLLFELIRLYIHLRKTLSIKTLFDELIRLDKFEMILNYNAYGSSQADIKMALIDYLRQYNKNHIHDDRLLGVYLRFSLCKELGDALQKRAIGILNQLIPSLEAPNPNQKKRDSFRDQLERVKEHFLNAVDALKLGQCYNSVFECENMIRLIEYQMILIQKGNFPVVLKLTRDQAMRFMIYSDDFVGAYTIANVHGLNSHKYWTTVLWNKAIIQGKMEYFLLYREYLPADDKLYRELLNIYKKSNTDDPIITENIKLLVLLHPNFREQTQLCESLPREWMSEAYKILDRRSGH